MSKKQWIKPEVTIISNPDPEIQQLLSLEMAKKTKLGKPKKERPTNYSEKLAVKGTFLDVIKASVKHAEKKKK